MMYRPVKKWYRSVNLLFRLTVIFNFLIAWYLAIQVYLPAFCCLSEYFPASSQLRFSFEKIEPKIENNTLLEEWQEVTGT